MVLAKLVFFVAFTAIIQKTWGTALTGGKLGIVGGYEVAIKDAPYMASLYLFGRFSCGGSIIHEKFIMTAAHCVRIPGREDVLQPNDIKVLVGSDRLNYGGIFLDVDRVLVHQGYNNNTSHKDIALMKVRQKLIDVYFRTARVRLPVDSRVILGGTVVNVTGWGWIKDNGHISSNELRQITVPVVSNECCIRIFDNLIDAQMCAGSRGFDSCQGDSGGPMTYEGVQLGIVSKGSYCGVYPGIYTRVSSYLNWIKTNIEENL